MTPGSSARLAAALTLATLVTACATPSLGPPPPGAPPPPPVVRGSANFSAADFAWSQRAGGNIIAGRVTYRQGPTRFTCAGSSVVLTPETAWAIRRMEALYGSAERAALPSDEVRARTPHAPPGDAGPFVKRTSCDDADQFAFGGLPDGAWYAITVVRPVGNARAPNMALMKRVVVRGGRTAPLVM
ncbi:hypothetical protein [uncultured Phenylobacterium sp.]|uniref:hypothetical protein n=1 Tax=uncultured Phenylobacterium sp. TaxID=349273 RepID=UPI0025D65464|nr:hypothetical protein [uncultured Phenylobacterium sp.]